MVPAIHSSIDTTLPRRFRQQVACHGSRPAVRYDDVEISYHALFARTLRLAAAIRAGTAGEAAAVALLVPQGIEQIVSVLAVLEAGCWYVPLDPADPPERLRHQLGRAGARMLLAGGATAELGRAVTGDGCACLCVDEMATHAGPVDEGPPPDDPHALAYVYFTSGTTGEPKGVMDTHRNVLHNVGRYTRTLGIGPDDRLTLLQAAHFSGAVSNVFGALLNGALLLPYDVERDGAGAPLARWLVRERATIYHSVPSLFRSVCVPGMRFPDVRIVRLEGDAGAPRDVDRFGEHFDSHAVLVHGLGATETGICRQLFVPHGTRVIGDVLPIGYAVEDMEVRVLDAAGAPVGPGIVGELAVRSRFLSPGYWRDPERTAAAFRPDPEDPTVREYRTGDLGRLRSDGCLEHLGRADRQLKVRGQWVDTAAVETLLATLPGVSEAAVAGHRQADGELTLSAWIVMIPGAPPPTLACLRERLAAALPPHAVPATARIVDALPLGPNGKLDRRALAPTLGQPLSHGVARGAPRDAIEAALAGIWKDVLRRGEIGVEDSFVALGGDSLGAVQVALAIERQLGIAIPHSVLVEEPTIARLAARLQSSGNAAATGTLVRLRSAGTRPPLVCVHELESDPFLFAALAQRLPSDQPVHALRFPAGEKVERVPRTLSALAARYLADLEAVAPGPIALVGFCFGGVVALEMARQRAAAGRPVTHVALLNVTAYDLPALVSARARARFRRRWGARLRYLRNKPDRWRWIERRLKRVAGDLAWRAVLPVALAGAAPASPASEALTHAVLRSAFRRHVARPYERDVGLALAAETLPLYADDPGEAWIGVARGRVDITLFPHDGYAMLQEPEVIRLAAWLERALEASAPTVPDGDARTRVPARAFSSSA